MESAAGTDSQDSDDLVPPGISASEYDKSKIALQNVGTTPTPSPSSKFTSAKGIQNAKKRLRAFSIQKKTPITAMAIPKPVTTGSATVLIGKLSSVKTTPKPEKEADGEKKPPKPPKPGSARRVQDSYSNLQKRNIAEIEDMKRKMELVELGIPLGLICPSATSEKAMPTKAMPPIKSFLDPSKVDELIREAKKARAAGREFKFDYQKLLPDYDNPFQRKKDEPIETEKKEEYPSTSRVERRDDNEKTDRWKSDKYDMRTFMYDKAERRESKDKYREDKEKYRDEREKYRDNKEKYREDKEKYKAKDKEEPKRPESRKGRKETDVNLSEYFVCDSWSLDNEDKSNSSPRINKENRLLVRDKPKEPADMLKENFKRKVSTSSDSPVGKQKMEKLKPVIDAYKFDLDPNEEEDALDLYDIDCQTEKYSKTPVTKQILYDSPTDLKLFEYDQDMSKESVIDANDDNFLESVINEIKQENMSDDTSQDNRTGLVEYDSPKEDDDEFKIEMSQGSVTPELDDRMRDLQSSQQSHYSDGYRSTESGYKSTESGYKSERDYKSEDSRRSDDFRLSMEKEINSSLERKMSRSTVDSLETWSFVLKICQPLLFRHDKNKCYKETHTNPKLWYTISPKACNCVKDRSVVYEELEMCKMSLVDRVYGCDQIPDALSPPNRSWYPRVGCVPHTGPVQLSSDWETDEPRRSTTPQQDSCLHREYQRFIESVWTEVADAKPETSRSTTPDKMARQESRKKKKTEDAEKDAEDKKKTKKIKLSSEGWSQESDIEDEPEKAISKKIKTEKEKIRKRKHSPSLSDSSSEGDSKKKKKIKKKVIKKTKTKLAKKRRISKKVKKRLKEKQKKKKMPKIEKISDDSEKDDREKKKHSKLKKKAQAKTKKAQKKKKVKPKSSSSSSSSSSTSSSSSDSESEVEKKKIKKKALLLKKKKKEKKRKRKESSESTQSEEDLFDVNVLNNIKTERLTDDEKHQQMNDFSPRRQKPKEREIINVKELQNDFVGNNIHIKQEKDDTIKVSPVSEEVVEKFEANDEGKDEEEASVYIKPQEAENKEEIPAAVPEPIFPETLMPEEKNIPLPDDSKIAVEISNSSTDSETLLEPTSIHLPPDSNIPLPAEIKVTNIPEPLPQIIDETPEPVPQIIEENSYTDKTIAKEPEKIVEESPQNISYCNTDVSASQIELYDKGLEPDSDDKFADNYEHENYEMYEQMAMAYQNDVANQVSSIDSGGEAQRIETVVRRRRGEIKCDWRAGDKPATSTELPRVSRWGLKPGEVNIVLTGGPGSEPTTLTTTPATTEQYPIRSVLEPVYKIESLANRHDVSNTSIGYDEAYQVTYGASDRLQYGDCFAEQPPSSVAAPTPNSTPSKSTDTVANPVRSVTSSSLDERIDRALRETVLGDVTKETDDLEADKDAPEKGILLTKSLAEIARGAKRVSFADGYKPGQDSDVEEPPITRKKKSRRYGCAWPCPATHPDHVPLWDALPPPPPPPLPSTLPTLPGTIPNLSGTISNIPGSLPNLPTSLANIPGTLPNMPSSLSNQLPGTLPNLPGTLPNLPGTLPNLPTSLANMPGALPNLPTPIANMAGTLPNLPNSLSNLPGALSNLPGALPNLSGSLPPPMQLMRGPPHAMPRRPGSLGTDPSMTLPPFMPPEPPPGLISFQ